jgi:peptidoglycan/LPS O-acetylase OafA/YrhL
MIKFILPIVAFITVIYGISYFWTNSNSKGKKLIALSLIIVLIGAISLTIYLIFD